MLIIFFVIKVIVHKEFVLVGQSILHTTVTFYGDCVKTQPRIWQRKNWLFHHDNAPSHTSFFTMEFLIKKNMAVAPHPLHFCLPN
jgi:hypothetical protein